MTVEKRLVTRNQVRAMGLNVSSTQFIRYEDAGLLYPIKIGNVRSARVYYDYEEVLRLLNGRSPPPAPSALRKAA